MPMSAYRAHSDGSGDNFVLQLDRFVFIIPFCYMLAIDQCNCSFFVVCFVRPCVSRLQFSVHGYLSYAKINEHDST